MPPIPRSRGRSSFALAALVLAALAVVLVPAGGAQLQAPPVNTALPAITGTPTVGQTLTATQGTWTGDPTPTFVNQWVRCPASGGAADGSDCAAVVGATTLAYVLSAADVGFRLRFRVTATSGTDSTTVASAATELVAAAAVGPPNTALPTITGSPVVGSTLTGTNGTWTGTGITFADQWQRCDATGAACEAISGATALTYVVVAADVGRTLRLRVTATNASGAATATSAATAAVTTPAPAPTGCPATTGTGPINVDQITLPARLLIDRQRITPSPVTRNTSVIRMSFRVSACGGRPVVGALVYATPTPYQQFGTAEQPTGQDGFAVLTARRGRYFPASAQQQNLVVFVRARKSGEDLLGGISTRRLVSFPVRLG